MIERIYFVAGVVKRNGEVKKHFHSNIHTRSWFPKMITTEKIVNSAKLQLNFVEDGDDLILTAFNRVK